MKKFLSILYLPLFSVLAAVVLCFQASFLHLRSPSFSTQKPLETNLASQQPPLIESNNKRLLSKVRKYIKPYIISLKSFPNIPVLQLFQF